MEPLHKTNILPQYHQSDCMHERFLNSDLIDEKVFRTVCVRGETKSLSTDEYLMDRLEYFTHNNAALQEEFYETLCSRLTKSSVDQFCSIIRDSWADGRSDRRSLPVQRLMKSVENYIVGYSKVTNPEHIRVINGSFPTNINPNFDDSEINEILAVNREMLDHYLPKWMEGRPKYSELSTNGVYVRRGLALKSDLQVGEYKEWAFINSYSLAFSIGEQFSKIIPKNDVPVIVNLSFGEIRNRTLFFSPFIPGMNPKQLELGIIPHYYTLKIEYQAEIGGIKEYLLEEYDFEE